MKILDRHVAKGFLSAVLVSFSFFLLLFVALHLFSRLGDLAAARRGFETRGWGLFVGLCRYYAVVLPFVVATAGPFALMTAGMWACRRFARDAETTAAQVAGVGLRRFATPMLGCGLVVAAALTAVRLWALPGLVVDQFKMEMLFRGRATETIGNTMIFQDGRGLRVLVGTYHAATRTAARVKIGDPRDLGRYAETDRMRHDGTRWVALDPVRGDPTLVDATDLNPRDIEIEARGTRTRLRPGELAEALERNPERRDLALLKHAQYTYPIGACVLLLFGVALALREGGRNVYAAAGVGLLVSIVYFASDSLLHGLAEREAWLPPAVGAWLTPLVFGSVAVVLFQDL